MFMTAISAFVSGTIGKFLAGMSARQFKILLLALVCITYTGLTFYAGHHYSDSKWKEKALKEQAALSEKTAKNARSAAISLSTYVKVYKDMEQMFGQIFAMIEKSPEVETITVYKNRLIPVPGMPEVIHVPIEFCPDSFLGPDDLRLFNAGATRSTGRVSGAVP
jgi:capsule polysaccharide export protein KpsC/LpsZ